MKRLLYTSLLVIGVLYSAIAFATDTSKTEVRVSINDGSSTVVDWGLVVDSFTSGTRQTQTVTLTGSAFTALTVPSGAKGLFIDTSAISGLKLKGISADNGISLDATCPLLMSISDDGATVGIQNLYSTSQDVQVTWL